MGRPLLRYRHENGTTRLTHPWQEGHRGPGRDMDPRHLFPRLSICRNPMDGPSMFCYKWTEWIITYQISISLVWQKYLLYMYILLYICISFQPTMSISVRVDAPFFKTNWVSVVGTLVLIPNLSSRTYGERKVTKLNPMNRFPTSHSVPGQV